MDKDLIALFTSLFCADPSKRPQSIQEIRQNRWVENLLAEEIQADSAKLKLEPIEVPDVES